MRAQVLSHPDNEMPVCKDCWLKHCAFECSTCKKSFQPGDVVTQALEKRYHKECFLCSKCGKGIVEEQFVDIESKPFHEGCATTTTTTTTTTAAAATTATTS
jgi:hypothetical protein